LLLIPQEGIYKNLSLSPPTETHINLWSLNSLGVKIVILVYSDLSQPAVELAAFITGAVLCFQN